MVTCRKIESGYEHVLTKTDWGVFTCKCGEYKMDTFRFDPIEFAPMYTIVKLDTIATNENHPALNPTESR